MRIDKRPLSSLIVGQVKDRALMEIKDGDHQLFTRIMNKDMPFKLMPIVYKVKSETGCWICMTGTLKPYPQVRFNGKYENVSRLIYEETTGISPGKSMVLHKCDNPGCINPSHLYLGTAKDNARDFRERGKSQYPSQCKPRNKQRKGVSVREYWENKTVSQHSASPADSKLAEQYQPFK